MTLRTLMASALGALLLVASGCGDDDGDSCSAVWAKICDRACSCTAGDGCALTDAMGSGTVSFDSPDDCRGFGVLACGGGGGTTIDYAACSAAVDTAMCIPTSGGDSAIVSPPECDDGM